MQPKLKPAKTCVTVASSCSLEYSRPPRHERTLSRRAFYLPCAAAAPHRQATACATHAAISHTLSRPSSLDPLSPSISHPPMPLTPSLSPRCCAAPVCLSEPPHALSSFGRHTRLKHQGKTSMAIKGVSFMCATRTRTTRPLVPDEPQTAFTFTRATSTALLDSPPSAATLCLCAIVEGGSQHDDRMRVPSAPGARLAVTVGHGQSQTVAARLSGKR